MIMMVLYMVMLLMMMMTTMTMMMMTLLKKPLVNGEPKLSEVVSMVTGVNEVRIVHLMVICWSIRFDFDDLREIFRHLFCL